MNADKTLVLLSVSICVYLWPSFFQVHLPYASFQTHAEQLLRLHGDLHRQLAEHFLADPAIEIASAQTARPGCGCARAAPPRLRAARGCGVAAESNRTTSA